LDCDPFGILELDFGVYLKFGICHLEFSRSIRLNPEPRTFDVKKFLLVKCLAGSFRAASGRSGIARGLIDRNWQAAY
jgi:hypothetical protein